MFRSHAELSGVGPRHNTAEIRDKCQNPRTKRGKIWKKCDVALAILILQTDPTLYDGGGGKFLANSGIFKFALIPVLADNGQAG